MAKLVKGETLRLDFTVEAESVSVTIAGPTKLTGAATLVGNVWQYRADTSNLPAGLYSWEAFSVKDATTVHLGRDTFLLAESLSSAPANNYDAEADKTPNEKMVRMIEAMLAGNAAAGVKSYQINNRRLDRYSIPELLQLLNYYKKELAIEKRKARGQSILGPRIEFRI